MAIQIMPIVRIHNLSNQKIDKIEIITSLYSNEKVIFNNIKNVPIQKSIPFWNFKVGKDEILNREATDKEHCSLLMQYKDKIYIIFDDVTILRNQTIGIYIDKIENDELIYHIDYNVL